MSVNRMNLCKIGADKTQGIPMYTMPDRAQQIRQTHAQLICQVVKACQNSEEVKPLTPMLEMVEQQGWGELVRVIRLIVAGQRDESLLIGLDEEDSVIIDAILRGLQDPATLPDPDQKPDPALAAPGLAHMIQSANHGDVQALQALSMMAEQMTAAGGDLRLLGGNIKRLLDGERDPDVLCKGMSDNGVQLMQGLLDELGRLREQ